MFGILILDKNDRNIVFHLVDLHDSVYQSAICPINLHSMTIFESLCKTKYSIERLHEEVKLIKVNKNFFHVF